MRIVVKVGSNIVARGEKGLDEKRIQAVSNDVASAHDMGHEVVLVSSGAVAAGMKKLGLRRWPHEIKIKQAAAAVGQSSLMWAYERAFKAQGKTTAQVLLTRDLVSDKKSYMNSRNTLLSLLSFGVIPVVNENDTVSTDEIKFGDNDQLAAIVATLLGAERLVILSDVDGLHSTDPKIEKGAPIIKTVTEITQKTMDMAGKHANSTGTGGMLSKLLAARKAVHAGITVNIISGKKSGLLVKLLEGANPGTEFQPKKSRLSARKGWIAYGSRARGSIVLDDGARKALTSQGRSLLPSGIVSVDGHFGEGDVIKCVDSKGAAIARGITNYSSEDVQKIMGKKTSEIEKALGYKYSDEVIHRDNMVVSARR